jgi:HlyD family secretion protein
MQELEAKSGGDRVMKKNKKKRVWTILSLAVVAALIVWVMIPSGVEVDLQQAAKGTLLVTVDEQGETRAKERYVISAPVSGRLMRIPLQEGDAVTAGGTVAEIEPLPLGKRETLELKARLKAAEAVSQEAEILVRQTRLNLERARRE